MKHKEEMDPEIRSKLIASRKEQIRRRLINNTKKFEEKKKECYTGQHYLSPPNKTNWNNGKKR